MGDNDQLTAGDLAALDAQRQVVPVETPVEDAGQTPPEAPQEGAVAPEAPEAGDPAATRGEPPAVPYERFKEANDRRKEVERQAAEDRRKYEARFEALLEKFSQPPQPEVKPAEAALPDFNQDPASYIVARMQQQGASIDQTNQALVQLRQQQEQQQLVQAVQQRVGAIESAYRAENPEYDQAVEYMKGFRDRQLAAAGMSDPAKRAQQIAGEYWQMSAMTLQQGGNPAERLHRIAEASGWVRPALPSDVNDAARQAAAAAGAPDAAARLQMAQQGQQHSRGLGAVRGNGPSPMTAAKLLDMDDDAFLEAMKKSKDARKLMGA